MKLNNIENFIPHWVGYGLLNLDVLDNPDFHMRIWNLMQYDVEN